MINDLLDLSRLDAEIDLLRPAPIWLQNWIPHIAEPFLDRIQRHQQHLSIDLPSDLPPLFTDLDHFERIITELLNNACKYTPIGEHIAVQVRLGSEALLDDDVESDREERDEAFSHSRSLQPSISPSAPFSHSSSHSYFHIAITNTGVEIPPEECDRVFDRFYRILNSDPWKHSGTGLGLALVKKLTEMLGGSVGIRSGNGQTMVWLQIPFALQQ